MSRIAVSACLSAAILLANGGPALAKDYVVHMKNQGEGGMMVFEPAYVKVAKGDTVQFVPTDMSHNAESIPAILPAGATPFVGKTNQQIAVKFDVPGLYGVKCKPHFSMGMVALVQVGKTPANLADARATKLPGLAAKRMTPLLAQVK